MGGRSLQDVQLSHIERARREIHRDRILEMQQTVHDFGTFPLGCPECASKQIGWSICFGKHERLEDDEQDCVHSGFRHLHYSCSCGFAWVTRTKSDPQNGELPVSADDAYMGFAAVLKHMGASVTLKRSEIEVARRGRVTVDRSTDRDEVVYRYLPPPEEGAAAAYGPPDDLPF